MQGPWIIAFTVQWIVVLILALLVFGILRHLNIMEQRWIATTPATSAYEVGQHIAEFELLDATGVMLRSSDLLEQSEGAVIIFVTTSCPSCVMLLTQVSELVSRPDVELKKRLIVIGEGGSGTLERLLEANPGLRDSRAAMLSDDAGTVLREYGVTSVPTALVVDRRGRLLDQNLNPHVEKWLYAKLGVVPTVESPSGTRVSMVQHVAVRGGR